MDLDRWNAWSPADLATRLTDLPIRWAVAGGWAIDLFAGSEPRAHDDLEIVTSRTGLAAVQSALAEIQWFAIRDGEPVAIDRDPAALTGTWQTWGWDAGTGAWRIDVMREPWTPDSWVYRRSPGITLSLSRALCTDADGIPYLAPECVLLFKAKHNRAKDLRDLKLVLPLMSPAQRQWLREALLREHPGHSWLELI